MHYYCGKPCYGIPYQGSKSTVAGDIIKVLPANDTFVDLFFGGGAVTHAAICSGKYRRYLCNDMRPGQVDLFIDAAEGKYAQEKRWISREDFFRLKDTDPYVRLCWSFGNDGRTYLYSREREPWQKARWQFCMTGDREPLRLLGVDVPEELAQLPTPHDRRLALRQLWRSLRLKRCDLESLESLERIQSLERLERIQSLESLTVGAAMPSSPTATKANVGGATLLSPNTHERGKNDALLGDKSVAPPTIAGQALLALQASKGRAVCDESTAAPGLRQLITARQGDYRQIELPAEGATVYADPPYRGTASYGKTKFDHEAFYEWLRQAPCPVYVSEIEMPSDFRCVWETSKLNTFSATATKKRTERLFVHERWV